MNLETLTTGALVVRACRCQGVGRPPYPFVLHLRRTALLQAAAAGCHLLWPPREGEHWALSGSGIVPGVATLPGRRGRLPVIRGPRPQVCCNAVKKHLGLEECFVRVKIAGDGTG